MGAERLTGFETMVTVDGNVLQAGVKSRPSNDHQNVENAQGWITRAVVLQTYFADEDDRSGWTKGKQRAVLCDVRTYGRYSRNLPKVPVLQRAHGLHDHDIYTPRPATVHLEGGELATSGGDTPPTSAESMDGDHVLVVFLDNDPTQPHILPGVLAHPSSAYTPVKADGHVRRIRHNGTLLAWDDHGNIRIDATGAAKYELGDKGAEVSNSGTGGQITLVTTDGSNKTSIHLNEQGQILLGSDPATPSDEPMVLGNLWIALMRELIDQIKAITVPTGVGPSSIPINGAALEAIAAKIEAGDHVSDFIFGRKGY